MILTETICDVSVEGRFWSRHLVATMVKTRRFHESLFEQNEENEHRCLNIITSLLNIDCSEVDTLRNDDPINLPTRWFCHVYGVISPVHGVRLSSGKKHCVFKEEDYKKREGPNWANLTF